MPTLKSFNPANGELVGEVAVTPADTVPAIVARARAAQSSWEAIGFDERARLMTQGGNRMVERADELGKLLTREMGKPLPEGTGEVRGCGASMAAKLADIADALKPETREDDYTVSTLYHDPFGVCAVITPWNFPFSMPHWLLVPALVAGNTVVFKPSEETPLIGQAYADCMNDFLPPGVLQVIHGDEAQGKALVNADVDMIAFTGSRDAGRQILSAAGSGLKRVILELGGKDPLIVLDDADIAVAARFAASNSFRNAGQVCVSTERIYVHERVAAPFLSALVEETKKLAAAVGDGMEATTKIGPMINARQRDSVLAKIDDAVNHGAKIAFGGQSKGNFVTPTVLTGVTQDMRIAREETFGPVACVLTVRDDEEAVKFANDSPYGLGAAVFGGDQRAAAVARRLKAGMIGVNKGCGGASGTPWVGARQSGYGYHGSPEGHRQFAQVRVVSTAKPKKA